MSIDTQGERPMSDPEAQLEQAFVETYLQENGLDSAAIARLPEAEAKHLMRDASIYAGTKLAEVEARSHFVHDIHHHE